MNLIKEQQHLTKLTIMGLAGSRWKWCPTLGKMAVARRREKGKETVSDDTNLSFAFNRNLGLKSLVLTVLFNCPCTMNSVN